MTSSKVLETLTTITIVLLLLEEVNTLCEPLSKWRNIFAETERTENVYTQESFGLWLPRTVTAACVSRETGVAEECDVEEDRGGRVVLLPSAAAEVWHGVEMYTGIKVRMTRIARTWGGGYKLNDTLSGYLLSGESDVTLNTMAHCCSREQVHTYALSVIERDYSLIFNQPRLAHDIFFVQFQRRTWFWLLAVCGCLAVAIYLISRWKARGRKMREVTWMDSIEWICCVISQQGCSVEPRSASVRVLYLSGFVFGMLVFLYLTATIITTLTSARSINTVQDLLEYGKMSVVSSSFPPFYEAPQLSRQSSVAAVAAHIAGHHLSVRANRRVAECVDAAAKRGYGGDQHKLCDKDVVNAIVAGDTSSAFLGPTNYLFNTEEFELSNGRLKPTCAVTYFRVPLVQQMSFGLRRGLEERRDIDRALLRIKESGLMGHIQRRWIHSVPNCEEEHSQPYIQVGLVHVYGAYIVLAGGYAFAMVLLLMELIAKQAGTRQHSA